MRRKAPSLPPPPGEAAPGDAQRQLAAALAYLGTLLEHQIVRAGAKGAPLSLPPEFPDTAGPLTSLAARIDLSPFERDLLLLCAGVELDSGIAGLCARAQSGAEKPRPLPTFSLALAALPDAHWSALHPDAPLRRYDLLRLADGGGETAEPLTLTPLRIDETVLHTLLGLPTVEARLRPWIEWLTLPGSAAALPSQTESAERIARAWASADSLMPPLVLLTGGEIAARREVVCRASDFSPAASLPASLLLPLPPSDRETVLRLWAREAVLSADRTLVLEIGDDAEIGANRDALASLLSRAAALPGRVCFSVGERQQPLVSGLVLGTFSRGLILADVRRPTRDEQRVVWRRSLNGVGAVPADDVSALTETLVGQFDLQSGVIESVSASALLPDASADLTVRLWEGCRRAARPRLDELAQRMESAASWDDIVLPSGAQMLLRDVAAHARARAVVADKWGFGRRGSRGLGISALFAGPSGTGKTLAAEVVANELRLDLYRIDLSALVSKYIGETEKNLRRVFDAAEAGGALLLFDEADALFGKRSEVKDSHDRYANIEVSYLLQRMETYGGLAVLTTNLKGSLDAAFLRRLRFVISFPFPDVTQREKMWERAFPAETPTEGLETEKLANLHIAGGNIRSMALYAASLAADQREPVRMRHLLRAARAEYAKLEKPLTDAEVAGWTENSERNGVR